MLFHSLDFWLFFPAVFALYWLVPTSWIQARKSILLGASYFFYGFWDFRFLALILLSTIVDYVVALGMSRSNSQKRIALLWVSILVNLGILGYFKYASFFIDSAMVLLESLSVPCHLMSLQIILPIGISFYTFQSLGYTIDVYRKRLNAEPQLLSFALFVSFFPQLLAGPIERARDLLPQFGEKREWNFELIASGFRLFVLGMVKKVVISSAITTHSQLLYMNPNLRSTEESWFMAILFGIQLFMDFSGYSDMAVGLGRMFGIRLSQNFNRVFASRNFADFWQRWHMTLGRWFRDYLLLSLVRNGFPRNGAYILTFALIGFWHGANWSFVVWGFLLGIFWLLDYRTKWIERSTSWMPHGVAKTTQTVMFFALFLWVMQLFPARNISEGTILMKSMLGFAPSTAVAMKAVPRVIWLALALTYILEWAVPWMELIAKRSQTGGKIISFARSFVFLPFGIYLCMEGMWSAKEFFYFQF